MTAIDNQRSTAHHSQQLHGVVALNNGRNSVQTSSILTFAELFHPKYMYCACCLRCGYCLFIICKISDALLVYPHPLKGHAGDMNAIIKFKLKFIFANVI